MGNDSIDIGLKNIWRSWFAFKKDKKMSQELLLYQSNLEENLQVLQQALSENVYRHGQYFAFTVHDNKKRTVSVATIPDRIVHRLVYDYLVQKFDHTFIYDVWSCKKGKGLVGAIQRVQTFLVQNPSAYVWRADIQKFFDSVNHAVLRRCIEFRVCDATARSILQEIITSYSSSRERERESLLMNAQVCQ